MDYENASDTSMNRKINNIIGNTDKGYYELKRHNKEGKVKKVGCFITGQVGSSIRNAATGLYSYNCKVGTENHFFSVVIATGETKSYQPIILYYDSPQQFEKHLFAEVSQETKDRWLSRQQLLKKK